MQDYYSTKTKIKSKKQQFLEENAAYSSLSTKNFYEPSELS